MGQPLCCSAANAGMRERLCWWLRPLQVTRQYCLASMAALLSSTGISHHNLLPHIPSICLSRVTAALSLDCSTIPKLQLPAPVPSRGPALLSRVCMAATRTVWFSFHLGCHRSAVSLSALSISPLTQIIAPIWGSDPLLAKGRSSPTNTCIFPPSPFILPNFAWLYIFYSTGQVLLSTLSWCCACNSVSEGVFLIYLWREMHPTSTYSFTILFSLGSF